MDLKNRKKSTKISAFTLAEGATHVAMSDNHRKSAFTLAEVLVTLSIIGVVAAITLPTLITNVNERRNSERQANIAQKITQAMEHMRATGALVKYDSTEAFVDELKNHLKINKICYKDNLTECWPTGTITDQDGDEYEVAKAKTGKDLGIPNRTTNNVGLVLADGASIILSYDNTDEGLDIGDRVTASYKDLPVGNNKTKSFPYTTTVTRMIDFVMDVNGKTKPNSEMATKVQDIRAFRTAHFSSCSGVKVPSVGCVADIGTDYESMFAEHSGERYYKGRMAPFVWIGESYYDGAKVKCQSLGMHLATASELSAINQKNNEISGLPSAGSVYMVDELNTDNMCYKTYTFQPATTSSGSVLLTEQSNVICIK